MKKYLVVDLNANGIFQYIFINEYEDELKIITDIQEYKPKIFDECYDIILKIITEQDIDYLMLNRLNTNEIIYDKIKKNKFLFQKTISFCSNTKFHHEMILKYHEDLNNNKLGITSKNCDLIDFININKVISHIYLSDNGMMKLDRFISDKGRNILHLILTLYGCLLTKV